MNIAIRLIPRLAGALFVVTLWLFCLVLPAGAQTAVDENLTEYKLASGISGNLSSVGSDTLANLMTLWAEAFKKIYPSVNIQVQAAGSSTAPPALTEATANLGPMSRRMKDRELAAFKARYGYKPTAVPVAIDALAMYVHRDNPLEGVYMSEVDAIFSSTRKCGSTRTITTWGDLDAEGRLKQQKIQLFGRNSVSGTYGFFKDKALCNGDFKSNVNEQPGSASVVQAVSTSPNGIGYSGIGYSTASVKALALAQKPGEEYITANANNAVKGIYPLSRFLFIYINKKPNSPLPPLEREFVRFVFSRQGQTIVIKDGYIPLPARVVERYQAELDL